jgi:zinc transporter, ZIP family
MTLWQGAVLGAAAGATIYLGLPFARLGPWTRPIQKLLNAFAIGMLLFLVCDILLQAQEPLAEALGTAQLLGSWDGFARLAVLLALGIAAGLLGPAAYRRTALRRPPASGVPRAYHLALIAATALGLHNLCEGLAIGEAASSGAIGFATILIVGFGLHNITEAFVVAAPVVVAGERPSWRFLGLAGLVAGAPTLFGTVIGYRVTSTPAFVFFLGLAAGGLFYVIGEMTAEARPQQRFASAWGLAAGFLLAYAFDLLRPI